MKTPFTPAVPKALVNPIHNMASWQSMRDACEANPGEFHGTIAATTLHWFDTRTQAWLSQSEDGSWQGWSFNASANARAAKPAFDAVSVSDWTPWTNAFDASDAPFYRWFNGAFTNAAFNEVDRHVLDGHGEEIAYDFEGDRWDPSANGGRGGPVQYRQLSRRQLLTQSVFAARSLRKLGLGKGDRIAINMPNILEQIIWTEAAKRLGVIYTPVFGGFSDKTLSDRIENAGAKVIITCDGASRNAETVNFKESYTDPALDRYISVQSAIECIQLTDIASVIEDADIIRSAVLKQLQTSLAEEITLSRAQLMTEIGKALTNAKLSAEITASLRTLFAQSLVASKARVSHVIVVRHARIKDMSWTDGRDVWADDILASAQQDVLSSAGLTSLAELDALDDQALVAALWQSVPPLAVEADFPLFIIYTSGSTGKPKGVVHVHGGYLAGVTHTMKISFDARPEHDRIWVVADPGWITGQSYLISASLAARIRGVVTEGAPVFPNAGRFASIIERYGITIFKAGVTFLKTIMSDPQNQVDVERYDMRSLKVATFCAEPTSPSVQQFGMALMTEQYINSYWATEHGGIVWTHPYGNADQALKADAHTYPLPWVFGDIWIAKGETDEHGCNYYRVADLDEKGELVITKPYPYLARTIWGDPDNVMTEHWRGDIKRFTDTYFGRFKNAAGKPIFAYVQGDFARRFSDGSFSLHGRSDDVINVSGHRLGTEEIEGAILKDKQLNPQSKIGNCIVIGAPHKEKGLTPLAFILPSQEQTLHRDDEHRLQTLVREEKGQLAVPSDFICLRAFPETRSGKYMRRFLRAIVLGEELGDTSTLRNPDCLDDIYTAVAQWRERQSLADKQTLTQSTRMLHIQFAPVWKPRHKAAYDNAMRVATVTIDNPPVNALSERVLDELETVLTQLARREDVGAVVLTGRGNKTFVAGADVRQLLEEVQDENAARALPSKAHAVARLIEEMDKPVIAAVAGLALGGGCELALACHWRVGGAQSEFGQPEINLFLPPGYGGTQRLPRIMLDAADGAKNKQTSLYNALSLLLSGRRINSKQALQQGLLNYRCSGNESVIRVAQSAAHLAARTQDGPAVLAMRKRHQALIRWRQAGAFDSNCIKSDYLQACMSAHQASGRGAVAQAIFASIKLGFEQGFEQGLQHEINSFASFLLDEDDGGKKGIQLYIDKQSPPLPSRARIDIAQKSDFIDRALLLPAGTAFIPGATPIPPYQLAHAVLRDCATGEYLHGDPQSAEREVIIATPTPTSTQALVYVLASEINYNDIWAITGIPVSLFDEHDADIHVTGSGGVGIVTELGEALQAEGRLAIGDIVVIYSGVSDLLDPQSGNDPMYTDFHIQGYQTPDGSHQQFMLADGPQLLTPPVNLSIEASASYALPGGTAYRALFYALQLKQGDRLFVEGAASGTGAWAVALGQAIGARVTGMVSSQSRGDTLHKQGVKTINRSSDTLRHCFTKVPEDADQWQAWERDGDTLLAELRQNNGGQLCSHSLSHAGEKAFARSFQALDVGGTITFFGASSGYHMTFMGKPGKTSALTMLQRAKAKPGQATVIFYGKDNREHDHEALEAIEAARLSALRTIVITDTDAERDFILSLGFGDTVLGAISLAEIERRTPQFEWPKTMPSLADPNSAAFKDVVRGFTENTLKPVGSAIGKLLRASDNPKGQPDIIFERAHRDSLFASTMLIKANTGVVLYSGNMAERRYSFYAPQLWMRQRRILMPSASIIGTHLCNAAQMLALNQMINAGVVDVPPPYLGQWHEAAQLHQAMWKNRLPESTNGAAKAVINHALPMAGLKSFDELLAAWFSDTN